MDDTVAVAFENGARVSHLAWPDDFAAAKNYALAQTTADYRVVIDADEWVRDGGAALRAWVARSASPRFGLVRCRSLFRAAGEEQAQTDWLTRVLPRGAVFEGAIHEQATGAFPTEETPLLIDHDGYLPEQMERKRGRNTRLLRDALVDAPQDGYLWFQLGCAHAVEEQHREACAAFERAETFVTPEEPERHALVVRYLYSLGRVGRFEEARALYAREADTWAESPDLHFVMADVLWEAAVVHPAHAPRLLPVIRSLFARSLRIGERPDLPGTVEGRGSYHAEHNLALLQAGAPNQEGERP